MQTTPSDTTAAPEPAGWLRTHQELFLTAVMFYTRLPCPAWIGHSPVLINRSSFYFPLVGWIVGGATAGAWWLGAAVWPPALALIFSTVVGLLVTGAFHEDGLADVCDGFGGGWERGRILEIMKDSRVGTYGLVGLGLVLAAKITALLGVTAENHPWGLSAGLLLLVAHPLSRLTALTFVFTHAYARDTADAKAKPVAEGLRRADLAVASVFGLLPLVAWAAWQQQPAVLGVLVPLALLRWMLGRWFVKWLGGYTGDCLGATQQLAEVTIYLFFAMRFWA